MVKTDTHFYHNEYAFFGALNYYLRHTENGKDVLCGKNFGYFMEFNVCQSNSERYV